MPVVPAQSGSERFFLLRVWYPSAHLPSQDSKLFVRGNSLGLSWERGSALERGDESSADVWLLRLALRADANDVRWPQRLELKVLIDDTIWQVGANVTTDVRDQPAVLDIYPFFFSRSGQYTVLDDVYSPQLGNQRSVGVYLPLSYHENHFTPAYPVLVMHDGQNLFDPAVSTFGATWRCHETLDGLINGGFMSEIVVVGVYNTPDRFNEMTTNADAYLDFIEQVVLPTVQKRYRVRVGRDSLGMLGSSLGGLVSTYAGWTRSCVWGRVAHMSIQFNCDDCRDANLFLRDTVLRSPPAKCATQFYIDSGVPCEGDGDQITSVVNIMSEYIATENISTCIDYGGRHDEHSWANRVHVPLTRLYPPSVSVCQPLVDVDGVLHFEKS
eukprot:TRINITY_DN1612_c0_g1_i1.p1 TRINITY_DN1612_c0_g1~~TRINITY_DN1612_c0_g1_i1.p1  ORF type:complete len:384 (-),score=74.00 TRINITY_DN1612_c0_g1_i1:152-1303(-)